ncbi:hypothetical protein OIE68_15700 [Nocardia vinacea]|uniref:hypothetical protein n=1 Tax=Nocardia vinacea TaxID=96468 RepID=UPI002E13B7FB|nr:hypothetical protein OIE68_15700 [Nocardia vinacea]
MSANRSRHARQLASQLSARTRTTVRLDYHDSVGDSGRAWHIHWTDGPTWQQMLTLTASLAEDFPSIDVARVRPARSHTALSEAVAVLVWLNEDIDRAEFFPGVWPEFARDHVSYPDHVGERWRVRGEAVLSMTRGGVDLAVCRAIDARIRVEGWASVLEWLDGIALGEKPLRVVR